jgi:alpha-glucosidase (family GH31 glycosyl hydrolase)
MTSLIPPHFRLSVESQADPAAVVAIGPQMRLTLLTSRLLRLEYDPAGAFEERPSQVFWQRRQTVPAFQVRRRAAAVEIETAHLLLACAPQPDGPFNAANLSITLKQSGLTWRPGDGDAGNLLGTARTLDQADGRVTLEPGLLSRSGWTLVDDSHALVFDEGGWLSARASPAEAQDWYFFGYGRAYSDLLADFSRVAGPAPLIPRWALGNWWSRYWPYSQAELQELMREFRRRAVPLSVCIIDMGWHLPGWTGYTWERTLFPDPPALMAFLHEQGLKTALNLHPADGVGAHEAAYAQMAAALGLDPASEKPVRFDLEDPAFAKAYFEILHHPQEAAGVDFWWMDWQQGNPARLPGLNLLWWINHLHFGDLGRDGVKRPFVFSRWGGLGNHRYPIGFSGDTVVTWDSLAFQPYFTAAAANVNYGWWSHDIGGHYHGLEEPELYTRWVQWGVFSPIFRLHSTMNPYHDRRPWGHDAETARITTAAMQLRHALIPYLYSMAWRNHTQSQPLIRPMYHLHPDDEQAYACPRQYSFGSELTAAPFTAPADPDTRLSRQVVWLPEACYDFLNGSPYPPGWRAIYGRMDEIPVFARAGAVVPLGPLEGWGGAGLPAELTLHIFPFASQSGSRRFELFEDDGETQAYTHGEYAVTAFEHSGSAGRQVLVIQPAQGSAALLPAERHYRLRFHAVEPAAALSIRLNGAALDPAAYTARYDAESHCFQVDGLRLTPADRLEVTLEAAGWQADPRRLQAIKLVEAMRAGTEVRKSLFFELDTLLDDPAQLAAYQVALSRPQMRALLETMTGAGLEHIANAGEELVVAWNNPAARQPIPARLSLSQEIIHEYNWFQRCRLESGEAPAFKVFRPAVDFAAGPTAVQFSYADLLKVVTLHNAGGPYPHIHAGVY